VGEKAKLEVLNVSASTFLIRKELRGIARILDEVAISYIVGKVLDQMYDPDVIGGTIYDHVISVLLELGSDVKQ
jgi:hypothetical protein